MSLPAIVVAAMDRLLPEWATLSGVIAVSGGADSVGLLLALVELQPAGGLMVAHVNHGLRGAESDADEEFVCDLAARLGLNFQTRRLQLSDTGNRENLARKARYEFLFQLGGGWIATAHHADDQAETVLHRLIRGTGLRGLRGIAAKRTDGPTPILRPLLGATRDQIREYLAERGQTFRTDSSNADVRFTRNRIRAEVLPLLQSIHPDVVAALGRTAKQAGEWYEEELGTGERWLKECEVEPGELDGVQLKVRSEAELRLLFRAVWQREGWPELGMATRHWQQLAELARGAGTAIDFPGGVHARWKRGRLVLNRLSSC